MTILLAPPRRRNRWLHLALLGSVIVLGLASRRFAEVLPAAVSRYAGDALWATAAVLALGLFWPEARRGGSRRVPA